MSDSATFKGVSILSPHMRTMVSGAHAVLSPTNELSGNYSPSSPKYEQGYPKGQVLLFRCNS